MNVRCYVSRKKIEERNFLSGMFVEFKTQKLTRCNQLTMNVHRVYY
jgi:hypothetical protein